MFWPSFACLSLWSEWPYLLQGNVFPPSRPSSVTAQPGMKTWAAASVQRAESSEIFRVGIGL